MRAAMFHGPGGVRKEDVPIPEPGEALVRTGGGLTCGTVVQTCKRVHPTMIAGIPSPFGHEFGGTIETVVDAPQQHIHREEVTYEIHLPDGEAV